MASDYEVYNDLVCPCCECSQCECDEDDEEDDYEEEQEIDDRPEETCDKNWPW